MLLRRVTLTDGVWYQVGDELKDARIEKIVLSNDHDGNLEVLIWVDTLIQYPAIIIPYHSVRLYFPLQET